MAKSFSLPGAKKLTKLARDMGLPILALEMTIDGGLRVVTAHGGLSPSESSDSPELALDEWRRSQGG